MPRTNSYSGEERYLRKFPSHSGVVRPLWGLDTRGETSINFNHPITRGWVQAYRETVGVILDRAPEGFVTVTETEIKVRMP